ncbi:MAG: hypothetical protein V7723_14910 [Sneathiella sp.]|uniref:hypothetical protein n=1 Tax=Sneathiella sp. TaxID=1964365 RepID=UPI003001C73D
MLQTEVKYIENETAPDRFEKRDAFRVSNPTLSVEIKGKKYSTENWSLSGLLLNGIPPGYETEMPIEGIFGPVGSVEMCRFNGHIVRLNNNMMTTAIELDEKSADVAALLPLWVLKYGSR